MERLNQQARRRLADLLHRQRPDVVLAQCLPLIGGLPALCHQHGASCVVLEQSLALATLYPPSLRDRVGAVLRDSDLVICCAEHIVGALSTITGDRVVAVPNGVDTVRCRPTPPDPRLRQELGILSNAIVVLHASNFQPIKRLADLVDAAAPSLEACPDLVYLIVGEGPDRAATERAVGERGLAERFRFTGWVRRARMPDHLALADMVIMPSGAEGMSLVSLEAMACGRLVIASDIAGMREIIRDGETGLLFRLGDAADLAAKTLLAARDPELRARIGRTARAYVQKHHRLEDMVARYALVLQSLVGQGSSAATQRDGPRSSGSESLGQDRAHAPGEGAGIG